MILAHTTEQACLPNDYFSSLSSIFVFCSPLLVAYLCTINLHSTSLAGDPLNPCYKSLNPSQPPTRSRPRTFGTAQTRQTLTTIGHIAVCRLAAPNKFTHCACEGSRLGPMWVEGLWHLVDADPESQWHLAGVGAPVSFLPPHINPRMWSCSSSWQMHGQHCIGHWSQSSQLLIGLRIFDQLLVMRLHPAA